MATDYQLNVKLNGVDTVVSSVGDIEDALKQTNLELKSLEKNSKAFSELDKQSKKIEGSFKVAGKSANDLDKSLGKITQSVKNIGTTISTGADLADKLDEAGSAAVGLGGDLNEAVVEAESLTAQLGKLTDKLNTLDKGSEEFRKLSVEAGQMKRTIDETNLTIDALAGSTTERFGKALGSSLQLGISGFQGLAGAQALFGTENEEVQQALVKLTGLLNLSASIQSFGSLGDEVKKIAIGFGSLTGAVATETVVQEAQTVATVAGTGATKALGLAMKSLPIIAIAAAVAALVAGIISYTESSNEAKEVDEARTKAAEEYAEAVREERKAIAENSGEFLLLIERLKQTNVDSKERLDLMNKINLEYGTTLENLQDEVSFQDQLTKSITEYVRVQTVKFNLTKNQEAFNKLLEEGAALQTSLQFAQSDLDYWTNLQAELGTTIPALRASQEAFDDVNRAIRDNELALEELARVAGDLNREGDQLTEGNKKYVDGAAVVNDALEERKRIEEELKKILAERKLSEEEILASTERLADRERELDLERAKRTTTLIDDLELEKAERLRTLNETYSASKEKVNNEISDERLKTQTIKILEEDLKTFQESIDTEYKLRIDERVRYELDSYNRLIAQLILNRRLLDLEITVGDQNVTDTLESLSIRRERITIASLQRQLAARNLDADKRIAIEEEIAERTIALNSSIYSEEENLLETSRLQKLGNQTKYYEATYGIAIKFNEQTNQYELDSNAELNKELLSRAGEENEKKYNLAIKATENLNKELLNINEEFDVKLSELEEKRREDSFNSERDAEQKKIDDKISRFSTGLQLASEFAAGLAEIENVIYQNELQNQTIKNEAFIALEQEKIDAIKKNYEEDIAFNNYTEEEKVKRREKSESQILKIQTSANELVEKSNRELAIKQFKRQKALNITTAAINTAQAVLAGIAQFGPPPSPLGIAAIASAGIIGAAQIAAISSQKFDGGSAGGSAGTITTPSLSDSSTTPGVPSNDNQLNRSASGGFTGFSSDLLNVGAKAEEPGGPGTITGSYGRVYVLESDITNAQNRVKALETSATFG